MTQRPLRETLLAKELSKDDLDYYYSSARFYENGVVDFGFLFDLYEEFYGD